MMTDENNGFSCDYYQMNGPNSRRNFIEDQFSLDGNKSMRARNVRKLIKMNFDNISAHLMPIPWRDQNNKSEQSSSLNVEFIENSLGYSRICLKKIKYLSRFRKVNHKLERIL